jgi:hypothetical protein
MTSTSMISLFVGVLVGAIYGLKEVTNEKF